MSRYGLDPMTVFEAIDLLEAAVEEKGADYIYFKSSAADPPGAVWGALCEYVHGPESEAHSSDPEGPGCIVGHVMHAWGVPLDDLKQVEGTIPTGSTGFWRDNLTPEAAVILRQAQARQDRGETWGDALKAARTLYEMIG
jgi:hypothetical protein